MKVMYIAALLTALFGLLIICVWVIIAGLEYRRELDQLTDDYLKPRNDSFINPKVNISDTVEDLEKEERFFNWLENENKEKKR
jgi:hypothetical protein